MRDLETIDFELRLLAAVRWSIREHGGQPSSRHVDELLDRLAASASYSPGPAGTRCSGSSCRPASSSRC